MLLIAHTLCSLLSYAAFLVAFVSGVLFLIQDGQLKHKHMGLLFHRLPPLAMLDRINFVAIGAGFALLSAGVVLGMLGSWIRGGAWWRGDMQEVLVVALWLSYLVLWLVRLRATLRGRRVALLSILGFSLAMFTFIGISRWMPFHAYL
jgi:ABC-type uncharacterized transport system permease subunit